MPSLSGNSLRPHSQEVVALHSPCDRSLRLAHTSARSISFRDISFCGSYIDSEHSYKSVKFNPKESTESWLSLSSMILSGLDDSCSLTGDSYTP